MVSPEWRLSITSFCSSAEGVCGTDALFMRKIFVFILLGQGSRALWGCKSVTGQAKATETAQGKNLWYLHPYAPICVHIMEL